MSWGNSQGDRYLAPPVLAEGGGTGAMDDDERAQQTFCYTLTGKIEREATLERGTRASMMGLIHLAVQRRSARHGLCERCRFRGNCSFHAAPHLEQSYRMAAE